MSIVTAVAVVTVIGLLGAAILVVAAHFMHVEEDPRVGEVLGVLPGANCGACGYDTCYAKSAAVVRGEATRDMCISYLKAKAESFANSVVNNIASGILVFDKDYTILQMNPYIEKMFGPYHMEVGSHHSD